MKEPVLYATGQGINFFESSEFEPIDSESQTNQDGIIVRNALRMLMMAIDQNQLDFSANQIFAHRALVFRFIKHLLWKRDADLLRATRLEFQRGFNPRLYEKIHSANPRGEDRGVHSLNYVLV